MVYDGKAVFVGMGERPYRPYRPGPRTGSEKTLYDQVNPARVTAWPIPNMEVISTGKSFGVSALAELMAMVEQTKLSASEQALLRQRISNRVVRQGSFDERDAVLRALAIELENAVLEDVRPDVAGFAAMLDT
ncbi:hypothetical protein CH272_02640 [Rhodococcus sp. 05-340-1]|nr:hypothetical protein CH271_07935 [Rhodococcus sp. 05-340-2]OZD83319.1 hypothetical protein CH272_02640 [Rhodococcus sp. 05-340-1]